jgi:hypothetical protein
MVSIKLDKERHLLRTLKGMKLFEEKTGHSLLKGFNTQEITVDEIYALLWSLLIHEDKNLELAKIEELADCVDAIEIIQKIGEALKG